MNKILFVALFSFSLTACVSPISQGIYVKYMKEGDFAAQLGDLQFAKKDYQRALEYARSGNLPPHAEIVALFRHARILGNLCEHNEAEKSFVEANRLNEKMMGVGSEATYPTVIEIGQFNYDIGRYEKAVSYFEQATAIAEKYGIDKKFAASISGVYTDYADALTRIGEKDKAKIASQKASALKMKAGKEAPEYNRYPMSCIPITSPVVAKGNDSDLAVISNTVDHLAALKPFSDSGHVRLIGIDRVMGPNGYLFGFNSTLDSGLSVKILPGKRDLTVFLYGRKPKYYYCTEPVAVRFNAEKGHAYDLTYRKTGNSWFPVLVDKSSNKAVDVQPGKGDSLGQSPIPNYSCSR